jgi:hypothetical protein
MLAHNRLFTLAATGAAVAVAVGHHESTAPTHLVPTPAHAAMLGRITYTGPLEQGSNHLIANATPNPNLVITVDTAVIASGQQASTPPMVNPDQR